jgi:hypothetical protein
MQAAKEATLFPTQNEEARAARAAVRGDDIARTRCRSFCFLERDGQRWTAFLITYLRPDNFWRGYFTFRSAITGSGLEEVRTADLFVEETEEEVDLRARGLGRPIVRALLDSAIGTHERRRGFSPQLHSWFRELLAERSTGRPFAGRDSLTLAELQSLYESYRLDQVAHLIALIEPDAFREMVEILLDGRRIDFRERDKLQLAMIVVQDLERRLPLPTFEVWAADYVERTATYQHYTHDLHHGDALP